MKKNTEKEQVSIARTIGLLIDAKALCNKGLSIDTSLLGLKHKVSSMRFQSAVKAKMFSPTGQRGQYYCNKEQFTVRDAKKVIATERRYSREAYARRKERIAASTNTPAETKPLEREASVAPSPTLPFAEPSRKPYTVEEARQIIKNLHDDGFRINTDGFIYFPVGNINSSVR
jgi:hypothetical protein